jgi:hypothetical protein
MKSPQYYNIKESKTYISKKPANILRNIHKFSRVRNEYDGFINWILSWDAEMCNPNNPYEEETHLDSTDTWKENWKERLKCNNKSIDRIIIKSPEVDSTDYFSTWHYRPIAEIIKKEKYYECTLLETNGKSVIMDPLKIEKIFRRHGREAK